MERVRIKGSEREPLTRTILKTKLIGAFCKLTLEGMPPDAICDFLCIAPSTFWNWVRRGETFLVGDGQPPEDYIYGLFLVKFKRATAKYRRKIGNYMELAPAGVWQKYMTILERRDRKNFGKNDPMGGMEGDHSPDEKFL